MTGRCEVGIGLLPLNLAKLGASAVNTKRVLILGPLEGVAALPSAAGSAFRSAVARQLGDALNFHVVSLNPPRLAEPEGEGSLVSFLHGPAWPDQGPPGKPWAADPGWRNPDPEIGAQGTHTVLL